MFKITAEECKKSTSGWRASLKKVASGSPENNDRKWNLFTSHEGNFQHHFACLFFARRVYQNCARVSHEMAQLFRWNHPIIVSLPRRYLVAFSNPDYCKLNSNWHTYTNPRPGQYLTYTQSHITRALADVCHDPGASSYESSANHVLFFPGLHPVYKIRFGCCHLGRG